MPVYTSGHQALKVEVACAAAVHRCPEFEVEMVIYEDDDGCCTV